MIVLAFVGMAPAAFAWTPRTLVYLGEQAARLTPPDLYRQLVKNQASYRIGLEEPFRSSVTQDRFADPDGSGNLDQALRTAVDQAIASIQAPRPFNEISYRLGVVAHYVALLNDPLATASSDPQEPRYGRDFASYAESTLPRLQLVFYGFRSKVYDDQVERVMREAFARGRSMYPMVGREYRRVGFQSGRASFDDRSTAYGVSALGQCHAVSDIAEVLRYIWLRAGGGDQRAPLPIRGHAFVPLDPLPRLVGERQASR
ncbi:MAG: hypothetical protein MPN21_03915 [Thermoanaerobaculia bacterium]|nr:hypothetical protein [Thermoanaerobaculia bacterium]